MHKNDKIITLLTTLKILCCLTCLEMGNLKVQRNWLSPQTMGLDILHYCKEVWNDLRKYIFNSCSKMKLKLTPILGSSSVVAVQSFQMNLLYFLRSASLSHVPQIMCFLVRPTIFRAVC